MGHHRSIYNIYFSIVGMSALSLGDDFDSVSCSEADRDTLAPLPPPSSSPWGGGQMPYSGSYIPQNTGYAPMPFNFTNDSTSYTSYGGVGAPLGANGSVHSGSGGMYESHVLCRQFESCNNILIFDYNVLSLWIQCVNPKPANVLHDTVFAKTLCFRNW